MTTKLAVAIYLAAIVAANLAVTAFGPGASIMIAFFLIGLDLSLRDKLHDAWEGVTLPLKMGALIAVGGAISYILNANAGMIAVASTVAFAGAASVDAIVYTILRKQKRLVRMNGSNLFGAGVDSILFPTIAFGGLLPAIVLGQFAAKALGGLIWSWILTRGRATVPA